VSDDRVHLDHGMTGRNRKRPGLEQALAAVREGDRLVVPKLDRLARSVPDARAIGDSLAARRVRLSLGGSVYDPNDPMGKMFFNILATFAEFEVDLLRMRTREGMAIARANGKLKGKAPKLSHRQQAHLLKLRRGGGSGCGTYEALAVATGGLAATDQLARRYWPIARRMASETLMCASAAWSSRSRLSSGSRRTDSTVEAAEPIGGRPPRRRRMISSTS
jgi:hypothetical protein